MGSPGPTTGLNRSASEVYVRGRLDPEYDLLRNLWHPNLHLKFPDFIVMSHGFWAPLAWLIILHVSKAWADTINQAQALFWQSDGSPGPTILTTKSSMCSLKTALGDIHGGKPTL